MKGIIVLLSTAFGIYLAKINIFLPWSLDVVFACSIFYYVGYILRKYRLLEKILDDNKIMICIVILYILCFQFGNIELAIRLYSNGLTCFVTAILGTLIVFKISQLIEKYTKYITKTLSWYGKMSMYILCFHFLETRLIDYKYFGVIGKEQTFLAKLIIVTLLTIVLSLIIKLVKKGINKLNGVIKVEK